MSKFSQTLSLIKVAEIARWYKQKCSKKIEDVLCKHIIRFGKKQWTFVIE